MPVNQRTGPICCRGSQMGFAFRRKSRSAGGTCQTRSFRQKGFLGQSSGRNPLLDEVSLPDARILNCGPFDGGFQSITAHQFQENQLEQVPSGSLLNGGCESLILQGRCCGKLIENRTFGIEVLIVCHQRMSTRTISLSHSRAATCRAR